jgi:DNA endonuclease I-HmuI-like, NUMOD-like domain
VDHNVSFPDAEKIKVHFRKNQKLYLGIGIGVLITLAIRRPVSIAPIFNNTNAVITDLSRRGHPGKIVRCNETGEVFASISRGAEVMGINRPNLTSHLNGRLPHANGYTFEVLGEAI